MRLHRTGFIQICLL